MKLSDFDFALPEDLIAQTPLERRDASRLLVLPRREGPVQHRAIVDLPALLAPGDLLVLNDARVIPARLLGRKADTGGKVEMLLSMPLGRETGSDWRCIGQASKPIRKGARLDFGELQGEVLAAHGEGSYDVRFTAPDLFGALERVGKIPLPPYIHREVTGEDRERYQTVFAKVPGAAAAPTAGLHFTPELLAACEAKGVEVAKVTLFVGPGTFLPVRTDDLTQHKMHAERYRIPDETVRAIERTRARKGRVVAVGTTVTRTLETAAKQGPLRACEGESTLFIYPGFEYRVVDGLLTNFHLPKSTLLMLVSAFAGRERVLAAYREAVEQRYRFFSYGDAMLIV